MFSPLLQVGEVLNEDGHIPFFLATKCCLVLCRSHVGAFSLVRSFCKSWAVEAGGQSFEDSKGLLLLSFDLRGGTEHVEKLRARRLGSTAIADFSKNGRCGLRVEIKTLTAIEMFFGEVSLLIVMCAWGETVI